MVFSLTPTLKTAFLVERGGFEPPKATPTDLQSVPFGHSGTSPTAVLELAMGLEPATG